MKGFIYTDQKCPVCGSRMPYVYRQGGCICPNHPEIAATGQFNVKFGRNHHKRFHTLEDAERHLTGIRFKVDEGTFDQRDYARNAPLGFQSLAEKWLDQREREAIKRSTLLNCRYDLTRAIVHFGNKNIKQITPGEIEDFIFADHRNKKTGEPISSKTRHDICRTLSQFMRWVCRRERMPMPEFPHVRFSLGWRKVVSADMQMRILNALRELCGPKRAKIWFAAKLLADNPNVRPGELITVTHRQILLDQRIILVREMKERDPSSAKTIMLEDEDIEFIKSFPQGFPNLRFFTWPGQLSGCIEGKDFGPAILNRWWKKACKVVGVEGVTLYPGTKHSTVTALGELLTPEQIKRGGTGHATSKAFERYMIPDQRDRNEVRRALKHLRQEAENKVRGNVVPLHR
jgi:hypothetical protein